MELIFLKLLFKINDLNRQSSLLKNSFNAQKKDFNSQISIAQEALRKFERNDVVSLKKLN